MVPTPSCRLPWSQPYHQERLISAPDLLDRLCDARTFTEMDLCGAYNLICIAEGDEWKTAFRTRYGSYDFLLMHSVSSMHLPPFQRFVNVFKDLLDVCVVV